MTREFQDTILPERKTQLPESLYLECSLMLKEEKKVSVVIAAVSE
jgi:hypothetical protein